VAVSSPRVSVVVPCFNAEPYLRQALESVRAQTRSPLECLVVDDGSTDRSAEIAASFGPPVRLLRQHNQGRAAAANRAIAEARGDLVMFLDADDFWHPEMVAAQVDAVVRTGAALAYCPAVRCDAAGVESGSQIARPLPERCIRELLPANLIVVCGACLRTEVARDLGGFDGRFWPADDYHLWLRVAARHRIAYQPRPLGRYRVHGRQVSQQLARMAVAALDARRDFLRRHPDVRRQLGSDFIRSAVEDPFFELVRENVDARRQQAARHLARAYLRRWPHRRRGWACALRSHLPWRLFALSVTGPDTARTT